MTKRTLIVGNWKMNLNSHEASLLAKRLHDRIIPHRSVEVVLAPSLLSLQPLSVDIDRRKFRLAAQNAYFKDEGAYTGEVSFTMLNGIADYAIVGHSERRIYFGESLENVRDKVQAAIRNGITPILCVGENQQERAAGESSRVFNAQVTSALSNLTAEEVAGMVVAYEPIWAISTFGGQISKPDDMQKAIKQIRQQIEQLYGSPAAKSVRILYGGSVNADTAGAYLALPDCDGTLVGNSSLNYHQFADIVEKAYRLTHDGDKDNG
ncbi:MAG TPA: triose-phosphate isomerase [Candidatus Saccharimonadales bacterium]|nr:triose-phosphate isomerase [Candidatus Saccharimonadales bacterium]